MYIEVKYASAPLGAELGLLAQDCGIDETQLCGKMEHGILTMEGRAEKWEQVVRFCRGAAKLEGVKNVVSHIKAPDLVEPEPVDSAPYRAMGDIASTDILIIGGGISGCGIARTLSKYQVNILVVEMQSDICEGTTKCNNGMIHSGYDSKPDTLKARLCVRGNALYTQWAEQLDFHFMRTGSFVCGFQEEDMKTIQSLYENGCKNGVPGIEILDGPATRAIEPNISDEVIGSLWTPSAGYVEPYEVALALAENAVDNGVSFLLNTKVLDVIVENGAVCGVVTNRGVIKTKLIINAAGLYSDEIAKMADDECFTIHPRRGALVILDKQNQDKLHTFIGMAPRNFTKGGGPQRTPEGTLIWGPSAKEVGDKEDVSVEQEDLDFIIQKGLHLTKNIAADSVIAYFAGNRAATFHEDFVIQAAQPCKGLIHVAGIQSPGLASAPAIAEYTEQLFLEQMPDAKPNPAFNPIRNAKKPMRECSLAEKRQRIAENPAYGKVICRCETVTEGEIVDAIHGKIPARTVDAVKRRTRAGMGRCQGGFCGSRIVEILARELGISPAEVTQKGEGSEILLAPTRGEGGEAV